MPRARIPLAPVIAVAAVAIAGPALMAGAAAGASPAPAPRALPSADTTATQLLARFYGALATDDVRRLARVLGPQWMIQRANGTSATRAQYLAAPPDVRNYQLAGVTARYSPPVLVVRYRAATQEPSATGALVTSGLAPRLATFAWMQGRWRMTSLGNVNPPG